MRQTQARNSGERGQAAVLVALCLFSMVVFLALATNMGILVNDRIRMQNTADLAAYAGAFEQARSLNRLAEINRRIQMAADDVRKHLTCKDFPNPSQIPEEAMSLESECDKSGHRVFPALTCERKFPEGIMDVAQLRMNALSIIFKVENFRAKETSTRAARFTARANFTGTDRPRHINFFEFHPNSPTFRVKPLIDVERASTTFTYAMWYRPGQCGCPRFKPFPIPNWRGCTRTYSRDLDTWFYKKVPGQTVYFPVRVDGVPMKDFLDIKTPRGGYFGADAARGILRGSDELTAFAVAKPYGGNIGPRSDQNGRRKSIKFQFLFLDSKNVSGYDYDSFEEQGTQGKFRPTYRARLSGMQDQMMTRDGDKMSPIEVMMIDLVRATHARPSKIKEYVLH